MCCPFWGASAGEEIGVRQEGVVLHRGRAGCAHNRAELNAEPRWG